MVLTVGEKVHVITRRYFEGDLRRHFAGVIEEVARTTFRARGYTFVFDESTNEFVRREEERTRLFSASDAGLIINVLPTQTEVDQLRYEMDDKGRRVVTDGAASTLNVSEFGAKR